jgi:hypothetical protein
MAFNLTLRKSFLYLFATVGLVVVIIGGVNLISLGLKTYVFTKADNYCYNYYSQVPTKEGTMAEPTEAQRAEQRRQCEDERAARKQSQAASAIAMLIVGIPLFGYTWMSIKRENLI